MIKIIKNNIWKGLNLLSIGPLIQLWMVGEVKENGWMNTFITKKSVDRNNNPIPWFTYPMVDFLKEKLTKNMTVFEYGCGGSTKWFAKRVAHITAVEDLKEWKEFIEKDMTDNMKLIYQPLDDHNSYSLTIKKTATKFDIIIVDGKERNKCVENCLENLSDSGIIILDDSFRNDYTNSIHLLETKGFRKINFWGMVPVVATKSCTTIFYRDGNVFNI
jgi:precorrin-6B methylase 2